MLTFSELRATDPTLEVTVCLELVGDPQGHVLIGHHRGALNSLSRTTIDARDAFDITVIMCGKTYQEPHEVAVIIRDISIGAWHMTDAYNHLAHYQNDRNGHPHARYLGFNGEWRLRVDQPFWLWHHHMTGQGMLIQPVRQESRQNS